MQFVYKISADLVVIIHLLWILFLILGVVIGVRVRWVMWFHLGGLGFSIMLQIFSGICPLTYLEVWLREQHDPSLAYPGSFIAHYAEELVYLQAEPSLILGLTVGLILVNIIIYTPIFKNKLRKGH